MNRHVVSPKVAAPLPGLKCIPLAGSVLAMLAAFAPAIARGQIYVSTGTAIGEYDAASGVPINPNLITGLPSPGGLAVSGSNLFEANGNVVRNGDIASGSIGEYTLSGAVVNPSLVDQTGLEAPYSLALSGSDLYVANNLSGWVGHYNAVTGATITYALAEVFGVRSIAVSGPDIFILSNYSNNVSEYTTSGTLVNANLVTYLSFPESLAVSGSDLFIGDNGTVHEYTTSGGLVNATLFSGVPTNAMAISGSDLFLAGGGVVGEYTTSGGIVNANLVTGLGLDSPNGIAVVLPEPASLLLLLGGIGGALRAAVAHVESVGTVTICGAFSSYTAGPLSRVAIITVANN